MFAMNFRTLTCAAAALLSGCGGVEFVQYEGRQQDWAVSPGGFVDRTKYELPVYHGPPPRAYIVLGEINSGAGTSGDEDAVSDAVDEAKKHGADAVILMERSTSSVGSTIMPVGYGFISKNITRGNARVIAIKWR